MHLVPKDASYAAPVIFMDDDDYSAAKTGIAYGSVTVKFYKNGGTSWTTDSVTAGNWNEVGDGHYQMEFTAADLDTEGLFVYIAQASDCVQYNGAFYVSGSTIAAVATLVNGLNDLDAAEILAAITTDTTKFAGANIANLDAAVSSRSSHAAADVYALMNDLDAAEILAAITSDSTKFAGALIANLDATISSRSSHAAADVQALLNDPTAAEIEAAIAAVHGAGNYEGAGAAPTVAEIAEAVHDVKVSFDKTTGALTITMADDTPLTSVTITDSASEVTRE